MNVGFSIHQKFVVLDSGDTITAFFGGLDLTKGRFDWSDHPIDYPGPTGPLGGRSFDKDHRTYDDFYNAEFTTAQTDWWDQHAWVADSAEPGDTTMPRQPWQDYYARIAGPSAWDIVRELVGRWNVFNREMSSGDDGNNDRKRVENLFPCPTRSPATRRPPTARPRPSSRGACRERSASSTASSRSGDRRRRVRTNKRYMIYVHSKVMICDDDYLILGSANLNERSLAGDRDTEIGVCLFADPADRP